MSSFDFKVLEGTEIDYAIVNEVLLGELVGCLFRGAIARSDCQEICKRYERSPFVSIRPDTNAGYLGAFHHDKSLSQYLEDIRTTAPHLDRLFDGLTDPIARIEAGLTALLEPAGKRLKNLKCGRYEANRFIIRSWQTDKDYALDPHEDQAQCFDPRQLDLGLHALGDVPLVAANLCFVNGEGGGLLIWNFKPTHEDRSRLATHVLGYPYPKEILDGYEVVTEEIRTGDVYFFDARYVHAVGKAERNSRICAALMLAYDQQNEIIRWT